MLPVGMGRQAVARLFPFTLALPSIELFGIGDEIYDGRRVAPVDVVRGHEDLLVFGGLINSARPFTECYLGVSASQRSRSVSLADIIRRSSSGSRSPDPGLQLRH
jgi:hypothetical protein